MDPDRPGSTREQITIQRTVPARGIPSPARLRRVAAAALADDCCGALTLRIVDADESQALNRDFRGKDAPTNVLSFGYDDVPELLGDVVICADVVAREAAAQGKSAAAHWAHMVVHGCLHLQGFDHQSDAEAARMEALETAILARLGFGNPYLTS